MAPAAHLPDLVLIALFEQMTLEDQICARKVCSRWLELVTGVTRCRKLLTILAGPCSADDFGEFYNSINDTHLRQHIIRKMVGQEKKKKCTNPNYLVRKFHPWNALELIKLTDESIQELQEVYQNATKVTLFAFDLVDSDWRILARMFNSWNLKSFAIYGETEAPSVYFWNAVNEHRTLTNLAVCTPSSICPNLPLLEFLQEASIKAEYGEELISSLADYASRSTTLQSIECNLTDIFNLQPFLELPTKVQRQLTSITPVPLSGQQLLDAAINFRNLRDISVQAPKSLSDLFRSLSQLHQLENVRLQVDFKYSQAPIKNIVFLQSPSVQSLSIYATISSHKQLGQLKLGWTIPNVQVIGIELCGNCSTCSLRHFDESSLGVKRCLRKIFTIWKKGCDQLGKIVHQFEDELGTAEEILAEK